MGSEFIVPVGEVIREYLEEYDINQKSLAKRLGMSEKHVSNFLNAKSRLTEEVALKLERIIPGVKAEYWLNYESKYREYMARQSEAEKVDEKELERISKQFYFKEVLPQNEWSLRRQAEEMLRFLQISSFDNFEPTYKDFVKEYQGDKGTLPLLVSWKISCDRLSDGQNDNLSDKFTEKKMLETERQLVDKLYDVDYITKDGMLIETQRACNRNGIYLTYQRLYQGLNIEGMVTLHKNRPAIYLPHKEKPAESFHNVLKGMRIINSGKDLKQAILL